MRSQWKRPRQPGTQILLQLTQYLKASAFSLPDRLTLDLDVGMSKERNHTIRKSYACLLQPRTCYRPDHNPSIHPGRSIALTQKRCTAQKTNHIISSIDVSFLYGLFSFLFLFRFLCLCALDRGGDTHSTQMQESDALNKDEK